MKKIKINGMGIIEMNIDEVIVKFKKMVFDFAHECEREFKNYDYNVEGFEDYVQIGNMEIMRAFETYDYEKDVCFSTYVTKCLKNRFLMIYRKLNAKKRKKNNTISLNQEVESNSSIESLIATKEEKYFVKDKNSLEQFIKNNMTKEEIIYLMMDIKKLTSNSSKILTYSSSYTLDVLGDELDIDIKNMTRTKLAEKLNTTRPTLNKRIKESVNKARALTTEFLISKT